MYSLKSKKRKNTKLQKTAKIALTELNRIKAYLEKDNVYKLEQQKKIERKDNKIREWADGILKIKKIEEEKAFQKFKKEETIRQQIEDEEDNLKLENRKKIIAKANT